MVLWGLGTVSVAQAQQNDYLQSTLHLQAVRTDLDFEGFSRETKINSLDIEIREPLASNLDGAFLIGYLEAVQTNNPIFAGQNTAGGYAGFDLRLHLINTPYFKMLGSLDYRYSFTDAQIDDQKIEWKWHQVGVGLHTRISLSPFLHISLGASNHTISGVEKAVGTVNQTLDFKGEDSLTGHIGLQLELDHAAQIGMEFTTGSLQGGRITFQRKF